MRGKKLPPTPSAERQTRWSERLAALETCLVEIQAAIAQGAWDKLPTLDANLKQGLAALQSSAPPHGTADATALRQAIALVAELKGQAEARQATIKPLLDGLTKRPADAGQRP